MNSFFLFLKNPEPPFISSIDENFKTKIINLLANSLVIKNNNDKRQAPFKFYRDRQKSIISYLIKMVVQGSGGNVAPGISKIIFKKQNKKLEARDALTAKGI